MRAMALEWMKDLRLLKVHENAKEILTSTKEIPTSAKRSRELSFCRWQARMEFYTNTNI